MTEGNASESFLAGAEGYKSAFLKHHPAGHTVSGTIVSMEELQVRSFDDDEPKFYKDGKPIMQLRVVIQTSLNEEPEDDGIRAVYIKSKQKKQVIEAIKAGGATKLDPGGTLKVQRVEKIPIPNSKFEEWTWRFAYTPPSPADPWSAELAPVAPAAPVDDGTNPYGVDPAAWAKLPQTMRDSIAAAKGAAQAEPPF